MAEEARQLDSKLKWDHFKNHVWTDTQNTWNKLMMMNAIFYHSLGANIEFQMNLVIELRSRMCP